MTVVVVASDLTRASIVQATADAWSRTLDMPVRRIPPATRLDPTAVLVQLAEPDVGMAVLPASRDPEAACWRIVQRADKPVLLVPEQASAVPDVLRKALLPLDGTPESADAVARTIDLLAAAGVELVVLHVFAEHTVPRYWDQGVHAQEAWESEFLARYCATPDARITVRSGRPGKTVLAVADEEDADLIALGWSRNLDVGRAATVRETVDGAAVPVLLTPCVPGRLGQKPL